MSKVIVHRHAAKYLKRLPNDTKERIKTILKQLGQNPSEHHVIIRSIARRDIVDDDRDSFKRWSFLLQKLHAGWGYQLQPLLKYCSGEISTTCKQHPLNLFHFEGCPCEQLNSLIQKSIFLKRPTLCILNFFRILLIFILNMIQTH